MTLRRGTPASAPVFRGTGGAADSAFDRRCRKRQRTPHHERLLYLYPEEWTGPPRARGAHAFDLRRRWRARASPVMLVTAGGAAALRAHLRDMAGADARARAGDWSSLTRISARSAARRSSRFISGAGWRTRAVHGGFIIHLKAAEMLRRAGIPYPSRRTRFLPRRRAGTRRRSVRWRSRSVRRSPGRSIAWPRARAGRGAAGAVRPARGFRDRAQRGPAAAGLRAWRAGEGPFVYCGSIADWKGLEIVIEAARRCGLPLRIVGGTETEWRALGRTLRCRAALEWRPRVALGADARGAGGCARGLIPTLPESGSGRYSCPMKLFDYARCGCRW